MRGRAALMLLGLTAGNAAAWAWALVAFRHFPVLLGTASLAYTFGLRHAFDADHIAAIDNVTRKLMQDGQRPVGVGLFFSLGHSTIVVLATIGVAVTAAAYKNQLEVIHGIGGVIGTTVSSVFLLLIAAINIVVLLGIRRSFVRLRAGDPVQGHELDSLVLGGGLMARVLRPLFRLVSRSWHMYPLGFVFGLGFDTATEVGLLGISAAEASRGLPIMSILVFPALFTAGMTVMDTLDSLLMVGAYGWAFAKPVRKLYYNMTVTAISVLVALLVGGIEALGLIGEHLGLSGPFWETIGVLNDSFGALGYLIVAVFVLSWIASVVIYRARGYDRLDAAT